MQCHQLTVWGSNLDELENGTLPIIHKLMVRLKHIPVIETIDILVNEKNDRDSNPKTFARVLDLAYQH